MYSAHDTCSLLVEDGQAAGGLPIFPSDSLGKSTLDRGRREKLPVPLLLGKIDSSRGMEKK